MTTHIATRSISAPDAADLSSDASETGTGCAERVASAGEQADRWCELTPEDYWRIVDQFSHDIRTPLCVISEYAALIRDGMIANDSKERNEAMDISRARVAEIQLQTDALLMIAKLASGRVQVNRETSSITEILHEAAARVMASAKSTGVILAPIVDPQLSPIQCDPRLTRCVLVNLLWSVLKAAPSDARVCLEASHSADDETICFRVASSAMRRYEVAPAGILSQVKMMCEKQRTRRQRIDVALGLAYEVSHILGGKITFNDDSIEQPALEFTLPTRADGNVGH